MLSAAKHLLFLIENKQQQIPRFARHDSVGRFSAAARWELTADSSFAGAELAQALFQLHALVYTIELSRQRMLTTDSLSPEVPT
jgi:hypothetical protein